MAPNTALTSMRTDRIDAVDALRGAAIVWMAVFHFCFDLNYFGLIEPRQFLNHDPFWTAQRTCILSLFLFCAGLGQALALQAGQGWGRFWRRWAQLAGCALLVSIGSAMMFHQRWIAFGVLHGIAVMLVVCRLAAPLGSWLWPIGAFAIALPQVVKHPFFDAPWISWLGLVTRKPFTEDYVPVLPWLGVMLWGLAAGQHLMRRHRPRIAAPLPRLLSPLTLLGRWPLSFYMLHQPLLLGALQGGRVLELW